MRQYMWLCLQCGSVDLQPKHVRYVGTCCDEPMYYNGSVTSPLCRPRVDNVGPEFQAALDHIAKETLEPKTDP